MLQQYIDVNVWQNSITRNKPTVFGTIAYFGILSIIILIVTPNYMKINHLHLYELIIAVIILITKNLILTHLIFIKHPIMNKIDEQLFDIWTISHIFDGWISAYFLPFTWMLVANISWEILEIYTKLGDQESIGNRIIDVIFWIAGWFLGVYIFFKQKNIKQIPWTS